MSPPLCNATRIVGPQISRLSAQVRILCCALLDRLSFTITSIELLVGFQYMNTDLIQIITEEISKIFWSIFRRILLTRQFGGVLSSNVRQVSRIMVFGVN